MTSADLIAVLAADDILNTIPVLAALAGWQRSQVHEACLGIIRDAVEEVALEQFADRPAA